MTENPATTTEEAEVFGPPAPERLFTYRYAATPAQLARGHLHLTTLDTFAVTRDEAFARALRFLRRQARQARQFGFRIRLPRHPNELTLELPR